jgi:hypothetical protein
MRLVWRILGYEVLSVGLEQEALEEVEAPAGISGGGGQNFERDVNPPIPAVRNRTGKTKHSGSGGIVAICYRTASTLFTRGLWR